MLNLTDITVRLGGRTILDGATAALPPGQERRVAMPVQYPTMPAFGGETLDTVFVTSASWPLPEEERRRRPQEGGLFAFAAPVPGIPSTRVHGPDGPAASAISHPPPSAR